MAFQGFFIESKKFMNYPYCGRVYFWSRLPAAWLKFIKQDIFDSWSSLR